MNQNTMFLVYQVVVTTTSCLCNYVEHPFQFTPLTVDTKKLTLDLEVVVVSAFNLTTPIGTLHVRNYPASGGPDPDVD